MFKKTLAAVFVFASLAACGTSSAPETANTPSSAASFPVTIDNAGTPVEIAAKPSAIISLSPTATEMLFAMGAGSQVVAVDDLSNFPAEAPKSDISAFKPNAEAIVAKKPDLVVLSDNMDKIVESLRAVNIPVLVEPAAATIDDTYAQLTQIGLATGNVEGAAKVVADMKAEIDAALAKITKSETPVTYYHELDPTFYSVTSATFIGQMYELAGLTNIADDASGSETGYPQLSAEYIVKANPDIIFLADVKCCSVSITELASRPGFDVLDAVKNGNVVELDDDIASRWGPRTPQLLTQIADALVAASGK